MNPTAKTSKKGGRTAPPTYERWMKMVNLYVQHYCGLSTDDLSDYDYVTAYEDGVSAQVAAKRAIKNSGG